MKINALKRIVGRKNKKSIVKALVIILIIGGFVINSFATEAIFTPEVAVADSEAIITTKTANIAAGTNETDRIYDVNITAEATGSTTDIITSKNDIVLVLDRSGSMDYYYYEVTVERVVNSKYYIEYEGEYIEITLRQNDQLEYYYFTGQGNQKRLIGDSPLYIKLKRMESLKAAAKSFVDTIKINAPDTRIDVVSFSSDYEYTVWENHRYVTYRSVAVTNNTGGFLAVSNKDTDIKTAINGLVSLGATNTDKGMKMAYDLLNTEEMKNNGRTKSVIVFSDGVPTLTNVFDQGTADRAISSSNDIKNKIGATIFTIGLLSGLNDTELASATGFLTNIASYKDSTSKHFYSVNETNTISSIFKDIATTLYTQINDATIRDYIDPRFELTENYKASISGTEDNVSWGVDSKGTYVEWTNATIPNENNNNPWSAILQIKAKDDFIGGNAVPTNTTDSGIYLNDPSNPGSVILTESFVIPTVNVPLEMKTLTESGEIFYNDNYDAEIEKISNEIINETYDSGDVRLTSEIMTELLDNKEVEIDYFYTGTNITVSNLDKFGTLKLVIGEPNTGSDGKIHYTLKVSFKPISVINRMSLLQNGNNKYTGFTVNQPQPSNPELSFLDTEIYCLNYELTIVEGELVITKKIDEQNTKTVIKNSNQSFVFKIERYTDENCENLTDTFYEVISFSSNQDFTEKSAVIKGLKKGYYKVTEEESWSWKYGLNSIKDTDIYSGDTNDGILFIGNDPENNYSFFGEVGNVEMKAQVTFNNLIKTSKYANDVASAIFK